MSHKIPYFKIKNAFQATWTLKQAAYLLLGDDPENPKSKIGTEATNEVSNLYYWLKEKHLKGEVLAQVKPNPFRKDKKPKRFSPDQLFDLMKMNKREYNTEIETFVSLVKIYLLEFLSMRVVFI